MGKWIYVQDKNNTPVLELKKIANKLMTASLKSKLDVGINFRVKHKELHSLSIDMVFFNNNINFSITFYEWSSPEFNKKLLDLSLDLMKDSSKFKQIEEEYNEIRFK